MYIFIFSGEIRASLGMLGMKMGLAIVDDECDHLADAELWAAIDSAAAARRLPSATTPTAAPPPPAHSRSLVVARFPQASCQHGPVVELPPSPQPEVAIISRTSSSSGVQRMQARTDYVSRVSGSIPEQQKENVSWREGVGHKRQHGQFQGGTTPVRQKHNRSPLQELPSRAPPMQMVSHDLVQRQSNGNCWMTENGPPEHQPMSPVPNQSMWSPWTSGMPSSAVFKHLQDAAMGVLEKGDYIMMQGKPFIKKSGWRKIAFFFNISFEIKDKKIDFDQNANVLRAEFVVRASMQSGRFADGWGSCDAREKRFSKPNHDIPSTAETRAKTRSCQDLLGIGEYKVGTDC